MGASLLALAKSIYYYSNRKGWRYHAIKSPSSTYEVLRDHS